MNKKTIRITCQGATTIPIEKLEEFQGDLKKLSPRNAGKLEKEILELGFTEPLSIWKHKRRNYILNGHQRLKVILEMQLKGYDIPDIPVNIIKAKDKREAKRKVLAMTSAYGTMQEDGLIEIAEEAELSMKDISESFTFPDMDVDKIVLNDKNSHDENTETVEIPADPKSKRGDIYKLGTHRLMCGDSAIAQDVERLMDGKKADMIFTDPPYALFGNSTGVDGVVDDKMVRPFFRKIFEIAKTNVKPFGHMYVCCDWHSAFAIESVSREMEIAAKNICIWDKGDGGLGSAYQHCYEMIWFFDNSPPHRQTTRKTGRGKVRLVNGVSNIWRVPRVTGLSRIHNAQKPVDMIKIPVENGASPGDIVLDLFGGAGSTMIAAQELKRKSFTMEIEPKYVDVTIARWENFTGKTAEKLK